MNALRRAILVGIVSGTAAVLACNDAVTLGTGGDAGPSCGHDCGVVGPWCGICTSRCSDDCGQPCTGGECPLECSKTCKADCTNLCGDLCVGDLCPATGIQGGSSTQETGGDGSVALHDAMPFGEDGAYTRFSLGDGGASTRETSSTGDGGHETWSSQDAGRTTWSGADGAATWPAEDASRTSWSLGDGAATWSGGDGGRATWSAEDASFTRGLDASHDGTILLDGAPPDAGATPLASFSLAYQGSVHQPFQCPSSDWEFPMPASGTVLTVTNTGDVPLAYILEEMEWQLGADYVPGVPTGQAGERVGVLAPGGVVTATYASYRTIALVGASAPFSVSSGAFAAADAWSEGWPEGVSGSEGAPTMYVADLEGTSGCGPVVRE